MREEATEDILKDILKEMLPQQQMADGSSNGEQCEASDEDQSALSAILSERGTSLHYDDPKDEDEASLLLAEGSEIELHEEDEPNTDDDEMVTETPSGPPKTLH
ncbi:hypothetical protein E5D57_002887 [Metarhizium anisopliae]|nr:hypothetical protein E5D57_002887 [Metarhizium anisopliae]